MKLAHSQQGFRKIDDCAEIARDNRVHVDEDDPDCVQGRELAAKMQEALARLSDGYCTPGKLHDTFICPPGHIS